MPTYVCAALLASCALCPRAAGAPLCYSATFTGLVSAVTPVVVCVPYDGSVWCHGTAVDGAGIAGAVVVTCLPAAASARQ